MSKTPCMSNIPFVEKYRPTTLNDIVLDISNKEIFNNMVNKRIYPNLLMYGPPGTGKTTTIINFVNSIQTNTKSLVLHLNASDERGIDTIRNQIAKFAVSKPLFTKGTKFIILDEVDYMTKSAQLALKHLIQQYHDSAVFCLICNYISKIEDVLKSEFIELKFNMLPKDKIVVFLKHVVTSENLVVSDDHLQQIQELFQNDIRSMLNYLQLNYRDYCSNSNGGNDGNVNNNSVNMINSDNAREVLISLHNLSLKERHEFLLRMSLKYNITPKTLCIKIFNILIDEERITQLALLRNFELVFHEDQYNIFELDYFISLLDLV